MTFGIHCAIIDNITYCAWRCNTVGHFLCLGGNMVHIVKQKKKNIKFNVVRESRLIENLIEKLPDNDTVYKIVSFGGFSSIGFVNYIAAQTKIKSMEASTLRVGKKHLKVLDVLHKKGRLEYTWFLVSPNIFFLALFLPLIFYLLHCLWLFLLLL
mgnify:CR=1 FL=1